MIKTVRQLAQIIRVVCNHICCAVVKRTLHRAFKVQCSNQQIEFIKNGKFSDNQVEHAQKVMVTRRKIATDSIQYYIMRSIWETVYPKTLLSDEQFQTELDNLDREHIASVANNLHAIAQYQLIGDSND